MILCSLAVAGVAYGFNRLQPDRLPIRAASTLAWAVAIVYVSALGGLVYPVCGPDAGRLRGTGSVVLAVSFRAELSATSWSRSDIAGVAGWVALSLR